MPGIRETLDLAYKSTTAILRGWVRIIRGRCDACGGQVLTTGEIKRTCVDCKRHVW